MKKQPVQTTMYNEETNPIRINIPSLVPAESLPAFEKIGNIETKYILIYEKLRQMVKTGTAIFIPGNVPSSKNSKEIKLIYTGKSSCCNAVYNKIPQKGGKSMFFCTKCKQICRPGQRNILAKSDIAMEYESTRMVFFQNAKSFFIEMSAKNKLPLMIGFFFIRDSKRNFDFNNATQILFDMMVAQNCLIDDSMDYAVPIPLGYLTGKTMPGVFLTVIPSDFINKIYDSLSQ